MIYPGYATASELEFIKTLGTFQESRRGDRKKLLKQYIKAAENRVQWGEINKKKCLAYARKCLKEMGVK